MMVWRWDQVIRSSHGARLVFVGCPSKRGHITFVKGLRPEPEKSRAVEKEAERVCGVCVRAGSARRDVAAKGKGLESYA
jgi:hypothetical protein